MRGVLLALQRRYDVLDLFRRSIDPAVAYYVLKCGYAFFFTMVVSVSLIFQTTEVNLTAFQLLLVAASLQGAILVSEMPTGVLADTYGRKRSVLIGLLLLGVGMSLSGAFANFWPILAGSLIWGFGYTFVSGAGEAWIADEVGVQRANRIYLRTAQVTKVLWIMAIPVSIGIATYDLNLPILLGGAGLVLLAVLLSFVMTETGFQRPPRQERRQAWRDVTATLGESRRLVRASPLLMTMLLIMAFYGMAGQGFTTLWVAHFDRDLSFPTFVDLKPVIWFGAVRMAAALLSLVVVEFVRRWRVDSLASHAVVSRSLFWINSLQMLSVLVIATTNSFAIAAAFICVAIALAEAYDPLQLAWLNQNVESRVRATVISMSSQMEAFGKTSGGPLLGGVASVLSLRSAIAVSGLAIFPALLFYFRAFGQGRVEMQPDDAAEA
jgi:MFS transporter, DHA3 family, tetracycline resistance protein